MKKALFFIITAILAYVSYKYIEYVQSQKSANALSKSLQILQQNVLDIVNSGGNPFMHSFPGFTNDDIANVLQKLEGLHNGAISSGGIIPDLYPNIKPFKDYVNEMPSGWDGNKDINIMKILNPNYSMRIIAPDTFTQTITRKFNLNIQ